MVLQFCKMLSLEESGQSAHEISLYYVLQLYGIYNNIKTENLIKKKSLKESDHSIIHKQLIRMWVPQLSDVQYVVGPTSSKAHS